MTRNHPDTKTIHELKELNRLTTPQETHTDILAQAIKQTHEPTTIAIADVDLEGKIHRYQIKQRTIGNIRWHLCNFCAKEFRKPSDLVRHLRVHTREKPFSCKVCHRAFAVKSTLTTHLKTHEGTDKKIKSSTKKKISCKVCARSFKNYRQLNHHVGVHMSSDDVESKRLEVLSIQEPIILTNKGIKTAEVSLKKRPLKEAGSLARPFRCDKCGGCYRRLEHLKQHNRAQHSERPFKCGVCRVGFRTKWLLRRHVRTHEGTKPHVCGVCGMRFTIVGSLERHMESHDDTKSVVCSYCFKSFKTVVSCRKHIKMHEGGSVSARTKDFECGDLEHDIVSR